MTREFTLREIAPPASATVAPDSDLVWLLNLDQIEPHSGRLLARQMVSRENVGASTYAFDSKNILYSKLRPYLNKVYLPDGSGYCTSELVPMRPDPAKVTREYLAAYLRSPRFLKWANQQVDGAKMPRVSMKVFWEHKINLPPLEQQKFITAILDKAETLSRKRQEANRLADLFLRASFLEMVSDVKEKEPVESLLANVPNAVRTGPFGSQLLVSEFTESGVPVLGIDNVVQNEFAWAQRRFISKEKYQELERYTVRPGDVMVTIMGTTGRVAIAPDDLPTCISTKHLCTLTLNQAEMLPAVLWACLRWDPDVKQQTQRQAKGAIMEGWNMGIVKGLLVPKPTIQRQREFASLLRSVDFLRARMVSSLKDGHLLLSSLQAQYFE